MQNDAIDSFIDKKNADSPFLTLADGDSARVKLVKEIKQVTKIGFGGDEVECLRLVCVVETEYGEKTKNFDNSSARFAKELKKHGIVAGCAFTISREGEKQDTTYTISDVSLPVSTPAPKAATPADVVEQARQTTFNDDTGF